MTTAIKVEPSCTATPLTLQEAQAALIDQVHMPFAVDYVFGAPQEGVCVELIATGNENAAEYEKVDAAMSIIRAQDLEPTHKQTAIARGLPHHPKVIDSLKVGNTYYTLRYGSTHHVSERTLVRDDAGKGNWMQRYYQTVRKQQVSLFEVMEALIEEDTAGGLDTLSGVTMRLLQGENSPSITFIATDKEMLIPIAGKIAADCPDTLKSRGRQGIRTRERLSTPEWLQP